MNCVICYINKIGIRKPPFGGFVCINDHLQCSECNQEGDGKCGICGNITSFVQMKVVAPTHDLATIQAQIADLGFNQPPSAPPMMSSSVINEEISLRTPFIEIIRHSPSRIKCDEDGTTNEHMELKPLQQREKKKLSNFAKNDKTDTSTTASQSCYGKIFEASPDCDSDAGPKLMGADYKPVEIFDSTTDNNIETQISMSNKARDYHKQSIFHRQPHYNDQGQDACTSASALGPNLFMLDDALEDAIINTSEIHFMGSSGSLSSLCPEGTIHSLSSIKDRSHDRHQIDVLSRKALQNFEAQNTANCGEIVEKYLNTYDRASSCNYPTYNCDGCPCGCNRRLQVKEETDVITKQMKSVCLSTESDPSLRRVSESPPLDMGVTVPWKFPPQDFFVMHTMGTTKLRSDVLAQKDETGRPNLDIRMQKILEPFQEGPHLTLKNSDTHSKESYMELPASCSHAIPQPPQTTPRAESLTVQFEMAECIGQTNSLKNNSLLFSHLLNAHRAYHNPKLPSFPISCNDELVTQDPPRPQYQVVNCSVEVAQALLNVKAKFLSIEPIQASAANILRTPIRCPESSCQLTAFVSDFSKHLVIDHSCLPIERISAFQTKSFFLDPRLARCGTTKCHLLYLLRDKITNLGCNEYKDLLPLLVMSSRINLAQICSFNENEQGEHIDIAKSREYFLIWITGIVSEEFPISVSLTVWANSCDVPKCHLVYSGELYSLRNSQEGIDVFRSGKMMMLDALKLGVLTEEGTQMINAQLVVH
uniref:DUF4729 domain-containing protein n=1 Tax=Glossina brevipalpis TaxID=37001 RepID=A0A1A9WJR3_9MUSC